MTGIVALVLGIATMILVFAPKLKLWGFLLEVIAAVILGLNPSTLRGRMRKYGIRR